MDALFRAALEKRQGGAVVIAGSDSDRAQVEKICASLQEFGIPHEARICSAHKEPERLLRLLEEYESLGVPLAYVTVAGGTDALSGIASYHTLNPVISCPPDPANDSCLRNPPGSANAVILNPSNVGVFVAQLYCAFNPGCRTRLKESRQARRGELEARDREWRERYRSV